MIIKIKQWCEGIIIAVVISIIIEMIIPDGKNKKYIKVIIGIYILFVSLSPVLEVLQYDFKIDERLKTNSIVEVSQNFDRDIKEVYISGIEDNLKSEIENLGYIVDKVNIYTDINYENIEKIELKIIEKDNIEKIIIGENNKRYDDIESLIKENYFVDEEKIEFK